MAKVLIVERDDAVREAQRFVLADAGHDVMEAVDGQIALRLLRSARQPMVVFFDMMLTLDTVTHSALAELAANRRLARRHAYAILAPGSHAITPALWPILTALQAHIIPRPVSEEVLLHTVALAVAQMQLHRMPRTQHAPAMGAVNQREIPPSVGVGTQHSVR